ncbi:hypothetical protein ACFQ05_23590 [Amycolatopsis umgeniensis]|uniref:Uncharacterized protein n=1 Tax=Amycolatopsis umgeniensis TaxID=336628 RepID=A0A841AT75_9PSEU|nr:hypothetical protein [Amycolatopsis umgeniensis]MBB5850197.1 hypothetical protein [Amycolatopsis umgeniensis]
MTRSEIAEEPLAPPARSKPARRKGVTARLGRREDVSPIISERRIKRFEFLYRRLPVTGRVAHVLVTSAGRRVVCRPEKHPTTGELLWSGYRMAYDVDLGVHVVQLEATSPSEGDKIAFRVSVDLIWTVESPEKVVSAGISDVRLALAPFVLQSLRMVTRKFKITESEDAEMAANARFRNCTLGARFGLSVEVFIRLAMDEPTLNHAAIQRKVELFREIVAAGDFHQAALQLALAPGDVSSVVGMLLQERDSHRQAVFDFVTRLLESDALDRWQIDDQVRTTLQWLRDSGYKVLTGSDEARKFSYGENHRASAAAGENGSSPQ